jgi:SET domain-containing protein
MSTRKHHKVRRKGTRKILKQKFKSYNTIQKGIAGYGVFAGKNYKKKEIVEISPFIQIGEEHLQEINGEKNPLRDYVFTSHLKNNHELVVFGNGSLFNHSKNPNVYYYHDQTGNRLLYYAAKKSIRKGEELFISYGNEHSVNKKSDPTLVGSRY